MHDVIVVGLGPAGSTAAYELASSGLRVLALDKEKFPRYKSCGGCISTKIERELDFDISGAVEDTVYGATFTYKSGRPVDIMSDRPVGYNVMRDRFDNLLVGKAREAGAEVIDGCRVTSVEDDGSSVTVTTASGEAYRAKALVGADGASGFTGRVHFGLNPKEAAVSLTAEVPYDSSRADVKGRLFIDFGGVPYGYAWIFPKKEVLSVGMAGDTAKVKGGIKAHFNEFVSTHHVLKGFEVDRRHGWTVPVFYSGSTQAVKGRVLLAGDTGHLVDPFLGEGIYYAIKTGKGAASAIADALRGGAEDFSAYQGWLEKEIYPEFKSAGRLSNLVYNHPRLWYSIIEKDPSIMLRYYDVIRGEESCDSFYAWVHAKIRSKPWKVLRRWIESRFIQP